ncbi:hypothetical protein pb186bvf_020211 [Paramecium bursaria]
MYKPHSSQIKYYSNFGATSAVFFTHQSTSRDPVFKSREVSLSRQQQPISQIVYSGQQFQQTPVRKHFNNTESIIRPPSPSSKKEQLQQEWNKIIDKTKNLQDNLVQLKNSVSNNLKKPTDIRFSKESTQSGYVYQFLRIQFSQSSRIKPTLQKINTVSKIKNPFQAKKSVNKIFGHIEVRLNLKIVDFLGRGKFSEVHLAVDQRSGFVFALKMIKKSTVIEFQMQDQLVREMQIQSKLSHTNIVKMYGQSYDETYVQ